MVGSLRAAGRRGRTRLIAALVGAGLALLGAGVNPVAASGVTKYTGVFADGATWLIQVPSPWNGTLVLYSHGYVAPCGTPGCNPALDVGDPVTGGWLLGHGYALAGSSYATTGWAIQQAVPDQVATVQKFDQLMNIHRPRTTIAWGHSLGGMITAALVQEDPRLFNAALPMCGVVAGGIGTWNQALDSAFAIQQLLGGGIEPQIVNITNPGLNLQTAEVMLAQAQSTPQGQARIALASALADLPGWFTPLSPEPGARDYSMQEYDQYLWQAQVDGPFAYALRAELEARAGGNPSWNTGVNYAEQLQRSVDNREVEALYKAAGLSLRADLATLDSAARISADPSAVRYLEKYVTFDGDLSGIPVLTMHTTGDGLVVNEDEQAYRDVVQEAGDSPLLRQIFVARAGHCAFTPAETIAAFQALLHRLDTGRWDMGMLTPHALNGSAAELGSGYNLYLTSGGTPVSTPPAFVRFRPAPFLRPFDLGRD